MEEKIDLGYPIIMVFYINREMFMNPEIMQPYVQGVKSMFDDKGDNIRAFFLPTDGKEKIECINPRFLDDKAEYDKITNIMEEISNRFDIGKGADDNLENLPEE